MLTRRDVIKAAIAAVLLPGRAFARHARGAVASGSSGMTFDYYISTTGSDSNAGTLTEPWSLNALNTLGSTYAGKSVGIIEGTYDCLTIVGGEYGSDDAIPAFNIVGGTSGSPTYIASCNSEGVYSQLGAVLSGGQTADNNPNNCPLIGQDGLTNTQGYLTIDGLVVTGVTYIGIAIGQNGNADTSLAGITVQNCYIYDAAYTANGGNNCGMWIEHTTGALIQNNYLTEITNETYNRANGILVWDTQNATIQYNTVIQSDASMSGGICTKDSGCYSIIFRYNYIDMPYVNTTGFSPIGGDFDGAEGPSGDYYEIYNNIVIASQPMLPEIDSGDVTDYPNVPGNQSIYNNTFLGIPTMTPCCVNRFSASGTITFYNNIIQRTTQGYQGDVAFNAEAPVLTDYNCYPGSPVLTLYEQGSTGTYTNYDSIATWAAALPDTCIGDDAHSVLVNSTGFGGDTALFVGGSPTYPSQAYQLVSGSPCSGTGSSNGQTTGTATDMGAWGGIDKNTGEPVAQIGSILAV